MSNDNDMLFNLLTDQLPAIITDDNLDKIITKTLTNITENEFFQIKTLFESQDATSRGLGLRLLTNYNIDEIKTSIRVLIAANYYDLVHLPE